MSDESDRDMSTRRVSADEMSQLQDMLAKARETQEVSLDITPELQVRVANQMSKLDLGESPEEMHLSIAVRQIFLAGLEHLESSD